ncbi:hypothetical protein Q7P37_011594 [Cladosporium fusiforme]
MSPDINSIPPSRSPNSPLASTRRPRRISVTTATDHTAHPGPPSPRSPSLSSLQAAATINAGLHRSPGSPSPARNSLERRRSSLMNNFALNDPAIPSPGEMQTQNSSSPRPGRRSSVIGNTADPHHHRQPSLGELHQELEAETEGQVNRLLHMIRIQQDQLAALQQRQNPDSSAISPTSELPTPPTTSSRPNSAHPPQQQQQQDQPTSRFGSFSQSGLPHGHGIFNRPHSLSRQSSARISNSGSTNSHATSPALRPSSSNLGPLTEDFLLGGTRDDAAFYQAETQMLTRENQMLKFRIRELGKVQLLDAVLTQMHADQ